jgi:hypothetical protein
LANATVPVRRVHSLAQIINREIQEIWDHKCGAPWSKHQKFRLRRSYRDSNPHTTMLCDGALNGHSRFGRVRDRETAFMHVI